MRLVKLTMLRKFDISAMRLLLAILMIAVFLPAIQAQDNSPYSKYGLGDKSPGSNVSSRGMAGIAAAYNDYFNVNYSNPASYSFFEANQELKSKKLNSGRAILNIAVNNESRTIIDPKAKARFNSNNIVFSNVMLGMPIRKNWGLAFGLRQLHNIDYKIIDTTKILSSANNSRIDNGQTLYEGSGGTYLGTIGTGVKFRIKESQFLAFGINGGYMFGKKDYTTRRSLGNDSTNYTGAFHQTLTSIGGLYFDAGMQYQFKVSKKLYMGIGAFGNWQQKINTSKNYTSGTYGYSNNTGYYVIDSVLSTKNDKGNILYPSSFTAGFIIQKPQATLKETGWIIGVDFTKNNWDNYRFDGAKDDGVKSNWQVKLGTELQPVRKANYFSNVAYRFGFYTGPDYVYPKKVLPSYGLSLGLGLPLANYSPQAKYQRSLINVAFEYVKRGNNSNVLKENLYRISIGFSLTDLWFGKRRYE